jgi:hypothetical protein
MKWLDRLRGKLPKHFEAIEKHLRNFCDENELVILHDIVSTDLHLDIYYIRPNEHRDFTILMTCGVSSAPLNVPVGSPYIELCILLPKDWGMENENWKKPENFWPIELLTKIGRYPHQNDTWLGFGHTAKTGNLFVGIDFTGIILLKARTLPEEFQSVKYGRGTIELFTIVPLYPEEMEFKQQHGSDELLELFDKDDISDVVDVNRKNVCRK